MIHVNLSAAKRTTFGKGECRRLRRNKKTPAVVYSKGTPSLALLFDETVLYKELLAIHRRNAVVTLNIEGDDKSERHTLIQEIQKAPNIEQLLHIDFLEIDLSKPITCEVPLRLTGHAKGVELGGELSVSKQSIHLRGCPMDIPDEIVADVTELDRGSKGLSCADLAIPANVELLDDPAAVFAVVIN